MNSYSSWGKRAGAYLLDWLLLVGISAVLIGIGLLLMLASDATTVGAFFTIVGVLFLTLFDIWNRVFKEGRTGQSWGKARVSAALVDADTGAPIGAGRAFLRWLVGGLLSGISCGLYGIVDYLFPLWDPKRQRLTDKIMSTVVVDR